MAGAAAVLCVAPGCLPEDTLLALAFSPDGQNLAVVSEKEGLSVVNPASLQSSTIPARDIDASLITWTVDSGAVAYAAATEGSYDIFLSGADGLTTRVSSAPSRESYPMRAGDMLLFLTREQGMAEVSSHTLTSGPQPGIKLPEVSSDILKPAVSPDGKLMAFFAFENLRPNLFCASLTTGKADRLTSETDPFDLMTEGVVWSPDSRRVAYLRNPAWPDESLDQSADDQAANPFARLGHDLVVRGVSKDEPEQKLVYASEGVHDVEFAPDGTLLYVRGEKLVGITTESKELALSIDLPAANPTPGGADGNVAFIAADQLVALTSPSLANMRILTMDLEDKFVLAEEYFRAGSSGKSYALYEELAASVKRTRDPEMARFIYIANLRRLGRTEQAVAELEKLASGPGMSGAVEEKYLWRLLGFSYLLELNDLPRARESFRRYRQLTSATQSSPPDSAINALQILRRTSPETAQLYASAVKARLDGNFPLTNRLFGELLTTAPQVAAVRREYMNALEGFDAEVYFFSPSQRPFRPTRAQRAEYLQRFVDTVSTGTALARNARLDLFLLRIEMGSYTRARELLDEALTSAPEASRPEGMLEVFQNYLETPEPQPWINAAMPDVFLHATIRPRLEALATEPGDQLLIGVAATKMALLQGNADRARREANAAAAQWTRIPAEEQEGELAELYGRLLVFRAREAELRGLYAEAADGYDQALKLLEEKHLNNYEMQEEIRYRAALLRMLVSDYPGMAERMRGIEQHTGAELINPTWDRESLQAGVMDYVEIFDTTTSTLKQWAAYEAGVCLGKLRRPWHSRAGLLLAAADSAPAFLQRKAAIELAALDEYLGDPWNAARWYGRLAAMPGISENVKLWCSYQIARLHISINYKVPAARDALGVIVSTRPNIPLAIQAQELLISTGIR